MSDIRFTVFMYGEFGCFMWCLSVVNFPYFVHADKTKDTLFKKDLMISVFLRLIAFL